jgi:general secretion pathway protein F
MNKTFPTFHKALTHAKHYAKHALPKRIGKEGVSQTAPHVPTMHVSARPKVGKTKLSEHKGAKKPFMVRFGTQDQILFTKRLAMILRAGVPIMEGLLMLRDEPQSRSSTYIYHSFVADITHGQPLSSAMRKFEKIFGEFCINVIRVGETSGTLHQNLGYLAEELKRKQELRRKVLGALIYPIVIVTATIGITIMLTVFIFPKIVPIFTSVNATLPLSTRMLIAISSFLGAWGLWVFLGVVLFFVGYFLLLRIPLFHLWMDRLLLRIPLFGKLSMYYNLANTSRTMSILLRSDVRIIGAMELVAASTRNLSYREMLFKARDEIAKGQKISTQFKNSPRHFPNIMAQMLLVGESTGNLGGTFAYLSDMYEEEINDLTKNLTTLLEPVLMIIMGAIVGFIAISIITPIYSITQSLNAH